MPVEHAVSRRRLRAGFTMIELVVILAILALLTGVLVTQFAPRIFQGQAAALTSNLNSISGAVTSFRQDVGKYPLRLSQLDSPIVALTNASRDLCQTQYSALTVAKWKGPYTDRAIETTGLTVGDALILDSVARNPLTTATPAFGTMTFIATGVDSAVYASLDVSYDGAITPASGSILWTTAANGTLRFVMPVRGC